MGDTEETQVLIQWDSGAESTWEPVDAIRNHYPSFDLEDKVDLNGGSIVMNDSAGNTRGSLRGEMVSESAENGGDLDSGQMAAEGSKEGPQGLRRSVRMKRPTWRNADKN